MRYQTELTGVGLHILSLRCKLIYCTTCVDLYLYRPLHCSHKNLESTVITYWLHHVFLTLNITSGTTALQEHSTFYYAPLK